MFVFIDESGPFSFRRSGNVVDCVGAVVVPERDEAPVLAELARIPLPRTPDGELKGSLMGPEHYRLLVDRLYRYADVLVFLEGIDLSLTTPDRLERFRRIQADSIVKNVPDYATEFVKTETKRLRSEVLALSDPLLIQLILLTELVDSILRWATVYYAVQHPSTLARFAWRIDQKESERRTRYERLWIDLVPGFVQARSLREAHPTLEGGDYSHMSRFGASEISLPEDLKALSQASESSFRAWNIGLVLSEDRMFPDSRTSLGVQLADVMVNGLRRGFNAQLPWDVARLLARMVMRKPGEHGSPVNVLQDGTPMSLAGVRRSWSRMANEIGAHGRRPISR